MPTLSFCYVTTKHHTKESSGVYSHIKYCIGSVFFLWKIFIHFSQNRRHIGFEKACSNNQTSQSYEEHHRCIESHSCVTYRHDDCTNDDSHSRTDIFICYNTSKNWC